MKRPSPPRPAPRHLAWDAPRDPFPGPGRLKSGLLRSMYERTLPGSADPLPGLLRSGLLGRVARRRALGSLTSPCGFSAAAVVTVLGWRPLPGPFCAASTWHGFPQVHRFPLLPKPFIWADAIWSQLQAAHLSLPAILPLRFLGLNSSFLGATFEPRTDFYCPTQLFYQNFFICLLY